MDFGWKQSWEELGTPPCRTLADYSGAQARWCPGCGDHGILASLKRLCRDEQLPPEKTVVVSGIGCSSRLPHYMSTYGFHGLHGRPLTIAEGVRARRPDLHVFVVTGDGDCCAIGTAHWIHAIRYNMRMTVLLLDNNVYGLTKMQSSPTTPLHVVTNTHPTGTLTEPLNPLSVVLGIRNASFVAQTVDWAPPHVDATLRAAHRHTGLSFVRILQRCPHYLPELHDAVRADRARLLLLEHEHGIRMDEAVAADYPEQQAHDPADLRGARDIADVDDRIPIGLLYQRKDAPHYDVHTAVGLGMSPEDKQVAAQAAIDRFLI